MATINEKDGKQGEQKKNVRLQLSKGNDFFQDTEGENPWDFKKKDVNKKSAAAHRKGSFASKNTRIVMLICRYIVYITAMVIIGMFMKLSLSDHADIFMNILEIRPILTLLSVVFIIDAILLNMFFEKNVFMILFAWILSFLYPWKRDKHVGEKGIGKILTIGIIASVIGAAGTFFLAYTTYGAGTLLMEDKASRHVVAECLEQEISDGEVLGKVLGKSFAIKEVKLEQTGKAKTIVLNGVGSVKADGEFSDAKNIPTILTYKKDSKDGVYKLVKAVIDDTELRENRIKIYESKLLEK